MTDAKESTAFTPGGGYTDDEWAYLVYGPAQPLDAATQRWVNAQTQEDDRERQ